MNRKLWFLLISLSMVVILGFCFSTYMVKANFAGAVQSDDNQQIKQVINQYFEARYKSFQNLKLKDFSPMIKKSSKNDEMQKEFDKLDLQLYHASVFHLRYQQYQYYLSFGNIDINPYTGTATADIVEGCDVVFETRSTTPPVSKMRNQTHSITLNKENGVWKITADRYEDYTRKAEPEYLVPAFSVALTSTFS